MQFESQELMKDEIEGALMNKWDLIIIKISSSMKENKALI